MTIVKIIMNYVHLDSHREEEYVRRGTHVWDSDGEDISVVGLLIYILNDNNNISSFNINNIILYLYNFKKVGQSYGIASSLYKSNVHTYDIKNNKKT